jgi:hypothetical protein
MHPGIRGRAALLASLSFASLTGATSLGRAQDMSAAAAPLPDVVTLKNGSMFRGTILELIAGDYVAIRLASGETKRFSMADVASAGPAAGSSAVAPAPVVPQPAPVVPQPAPVAPQPAPPPVRPAVTVDADGVPVHFDAPQSPMTLHLRSGGDATGVGWHYDPVCTAPCDATIRPGEHHMAVSYKGRKPVEPDEPVTLSGPSQLRAAYVDRQGTRTGGWILLGFSGAIGGTLVLLPLLAAAQCNQMASDYANAGSTVVNNCSSSVAPMVVAGALTGAVGAAVSLALILQPDHVRIDVTPLTQGLTRPAGPEAAWMPPRPLPEGLAVRGRF